MRNVHSRELLGWIERLNWRCVELNDALIEAYNLRSLPELADWNPFSLPGRAGLLKLIPRQGNLDLEYQQATYALHGTGITFETAAAEDVSFDYYPQPTAGRHPILGAWFLKQFIVSVEPNTVFADTKLMQESLDNLFQAGSISRVYDGYYTFYLIQK